MGSDADDAELAAIEYGLDPRIERARQMRIEGPAERMRLLGLHGL